MSVIFRMVFVFGELHYNLQTWCCVHSGRSVQQWWLWHKKRRHRLRIRLQFRST